MAPSPTGYFHVGSARTALFNWLFARQLGGTFVLRIEDTDAERNRPEWVEGIQSALRWLGLEWDEGPFFQSERRLRHVEAARQLLAAGALYACDCSREAVDARARERGGPPGYDGHCRDRGLPAAEGNALRFRVPPGATTVVDLVRGTPSFDHDHLEDFVVVRGNGSPVFLLANVVDDLDMGISHVIRGEDHLSNTPKQMLLWQALGGGPLPVFAHLPMLVNDKRQKLSKRRGDNVAVEAYRDTGFLPEAMVNYLALLGWSPGGGEEILDRAELVAGFRLEEVVNSPAFFDVAKLRHVNGEWIRRLDADGFADRVTTFVRERVLIPMGPLVQERVATLAEAPAMIGFFFDEEPAIDRATWAKVLEREGAAALLDGAIAAFETLEPWAAPDLHAALQAAGEALGLKLNKAQAPVRVAVTGRQVGPPLFESLEVLGRDRVLSRLRRVRGLLGA